MKNRMSNINNLPLRLAGAVTFWLITAGDTVAANLGGKNITGNDGTNVGSMFNNMSGSASGFPVLFTYAAYILGIGLVIAGLLRFRAYVDDPSRAALKDALIRFGAGVGLILLPWVVTIILETLAADSVDSAGYAPKLFM